MRPVHESDSLFNLCRGDRCFGHYESSGVAQRPAQLLPKPSGGVVSRLEDAQSTDSFMYLYVNGRYIEPTQTPIHESIVRLFAAASLRAQEGSGFRHIRHVCFDEAERQPGCEHLVSETVSPAIIESARNGGEGALSLRGTERRCPGSRLGQHRGSWRRRRLQGCKWLVLFRHKEAGLRT